MWLSARQFRQLGLLTLPFVCKESLSIKSTYGNSLFSSFSFKMAFFSTLLGESVSICFISVMKFLENTCLCDTIFDHGFRHNKMRIVMRGGIIFSPQRRYPFASISTPKVRGVSGDICCNIVTFVSKRVNFDKRRCGFLWKFYAA